MHRGFHGLAAVAGRPQVDGPPMVSTRRPLASYKFHDRGPPMPSKAFCVRFNTNMCHENCTWTIARTVEWDNARTAALWATQTKYGSSMQSACTILHMRPTDPPPRAELVLRPMHVGRGGVILQDDKYCDNLKGHPS